MLVALGRAVAPGHWIERLVERSDEAAREALF
jgi:hypothetical protein